MKFNATRRKSNTKMSDGGILWPQKETFFIFGFGPKKKENGRRNGRGRSYKKSQWRGLLAVALRQLCPAIRAAIDHAIDWQ